ncbi:MAG TPA: Fur family transcriptional regulator [Syntrophorhabdaceae bacterium]|nr:Fur family transcriptional regulator [Syntrophorhabdaceae bacterium]
MHFHHILHDSGLKATPKRLAILEVLAKNHTYLGPEDVWHQLKKQFKSMGLPTIYRNLEDLANQGILIKVVHPDRKLYYYYCSNTERHHHHFICTACRKVEDISFCGLDEIEKEVRKKLKGNVVSHLLQVFGICKDCKPAHSLSGENI